MFFLSFQLQNGILLPSLRPALPFLDLHAVKRLDFHHSVMEELRERLIQRIQELANSDDKNKFKVKWQLVAQYVIEWYKKLHHNMVEIVTLTEDTL